MCLTHRISASLQVSLRQLTSTRTICLTHSCYQLSFECGPGSKTWNLKPVIWKFPRGLIHAFVSLHLFHSNTEILSKLVHGVHINFITRLTLHSYMRWDSAMHVDMQYTIVERLVQILSLAVSNGTRERENTSQSIHFGGACPQTPLARLLMRQILQSSPTILETLFFKLWIHH